MWGNEIFQSAEVLDGGINDPRNASEVCSGDVLRLGALATPTGFEPAISALTGQYVKPLHHGAARLLILHAEIT